MYVQGGRIDEGFETGEFEVGQAQLVTELLSFKEACIMPDIISKRFLYGSL